MIRALLFTTAIRVPFTGITLSLLQATPNQFGFWTDRYSGALTMVGLGRVVASIERMDTAAV